MREFLWNKSLDEKIEFFRKTWPGFSDSQLIFIINSFKLFYKADSPVFQHIYHQNNCLETHSFQCSTFRIPPTGDKRWFVIYDLQENLQSIYVRGAFINDDMVDVISESREKLINEILEINQPCNISL